MSKKEKSSCTFKLLVLLAFVSTTIVIWQNLDKIKSLHLEKVFGSIIGEFGNLGVTDENEGRYEEIDKNDGKKVDDSKITIEETNTPKGSESQSSGFRLSPNAFPIDYNLDIQIFLSGYSYQPDHRNMTFEGKVVIKFNSKKEQQSIELNSKDLNIDHSASNIKYNGKTLGITIKENQKDEKLMITSKDEQFQPNIDYVLTIKFNGKIRQDMAGLYETIYMSETKGARIAAVTQFEPVHARKMVPCFDEPNYKAPWKVSVVHPKGTVAIGNGIEERTEQIDEQFMRTTFKSTPKMSSYLLALFVSEFEYSELSTKSGVRFRVWSRPEEKETVQYALEAGVKCLEYYEQYYGIPFPLEKQDMVAIPDFSAGAMENWGLITYRENSLLYDPKIYTGAQKRRVAVVIAHELAHQWFGNLVTLKWWDALWLNEGFATLVEYIGTDEISDNNFRMKEWFISEALTSAFDADSVASSHPMTFRIDKAQEVEDSFDTITYDKGGSVLSMIRKTLGEDNFVAGVQHYLRTHQYGNAVSDDLFEALQQKLPSDGITGSDGKLINVTEFAEPWTKQLGYPILNVEQFNETHCEVKQERFKLLKDAKEQEKYSHPTWNFKWDIPIWYQEGNTNNNVSMTWMNQHEPVYIKSQLPLVLNADSDGFYRVGYSESLWKMIINQLLTNHEIYSTKTRVRLIQDAFTSASVGNLNYSIPIQLIEYLKKEKDFIPWDAAIIQLETIIDFYGTDPEREPIQKYLDGLIKKSPAKKPITFVNKNYVDDKQFFEVLAAQRLISTECYLKDADCIGNMTEMFHSEVVRKCSDKKMTSQCSVVPAPFRSSVYCYGVKNGNEETFNQIMNWYKIERNQVEKSNLQRALTCSKDVVVLKKLMVDAMSAENSNFRLQDVSSLFSAISMNDVAKDSLLNFLLTRWDQLLVRIAPDRSGFNRVLDSLTSGIRSEEGLQQLMMFRKTTKTAKTYDFSKIEENIKVILEWRKNNSEQVSKFFENAIVNI